MDKKIKAKRMEAINVKTAQFSTAAQYLKLGKELHNEREKIAPARLNHGTYNAPSKDGGTAPLVITGDQEEFAYHQFEMIAFLNDLNQQPFAKAIHEQLARHERNLKYRRKK